MALTPQIVKRISAPYLISAIPGMPTTVTIGDSTADNSVLTINGNLVVTGQHTTINSFDTEVTDNTITLNSGETGAGVTKHVSGIVVDRGTQANVSILWNETLEMWTLTQDGINFVNISTSSSGSIAMTKVSDDHTPSLGGNLTTNNFVITSNAGTNLILSPSTNLEVTSPLQLMQTTPPTAIANSSLLFGGAIGNGDTGVYVTNALVSDQELITAQRAIIFSLIF